MHLAAGILVPPPTCSALDPALLPGLRLLLHELVLYPLWKITCLLFFILKSKSHAWQTSQMVWEGVKSPRHVVVAVRGSRKAGHSEHSWWRAGLSSPGRQAWTCPHGQCKSENQAQRYRFLDLRFPKDDRVWKTEGWTMGSAGVPEEEGEEPTW